ncbi:MAG: response regulator, partial [Desulfobulbaceae bacterium]|nr:response regulator [Desulfobulbaceae bacterium]
MTEKNINKIIVVDDEVVIALGLQERLTTMGYEVIDIAHTGEEAVEKARNLRPDLMLLDIMIPGKLDGIQVAETVKSELDIPVIFITAFSEDQIIERAKQAEPYSYIVKPLQDRELKAAIEVALYKKEMERRLRESERLLNDVFNSIQDGISVLNTDLTILNVNGVMKKWYAKNLPLEGKKCHSCYHDSDKPCDPCPTIRCIESGKTEWEIIPGLPGSPIERVEVFSYPMKDQRTDEVIGVVEFVRDITERTKILNDLYQERAQQRTILNGIPSNIMFVDEKLTVKWANVTAAKSVGKSPNDLIGLKCYEIWERGEDGGKNCPSLKAIESGSTARFIRETSNGTIWDETGEPIFDLNGKLVGIIQIALEITD